MKKIKLSKLNKLSKFKTRRNMNFLTVFLFLDLLIIFSLLKTSSASYVAKATGTADVKVALYAFNVSVLKGETGTTSADVNLGSMAPGDTKVVRIVVKNTDAYGNISDTNIEYSLDIITTSNIGLEYKIYKGAFAASNLLVEGTDYVTDTLVDGFHTSFYDMSFDRSCMSINRAYEDVYYLEVKFPAGYDSYTYQDLIESIKIQLVSEQSADVC